MRMSVSLACVGRLGYRSPHRLSGWGGVLTQGLSKTLCMQVGALTNIPALQQFCTVAAVAVLADFVLQVRGQNAISLGYRWWYRACNVVPTIIHLDEPYLEGWCIGCSVQLTWFVAGLAMDTRRVAANRYDAMPCLVRRPRKQGLLLETDQDGSAAADGDNDPENLSLITKVRHSSAPSDQPQEHLPESILCVLAARSGSIVFTCRASFRRWAKRRRYSCTSRS
jgi:hypothetical protein